MLKRIQEQAERLMLMARKADESGDRAEAIRLMKITVLTNRQVREMRSEEE